MYLEDEKVFWSLCIIVVSLIIAVAAVTHMALKVTVK